MENFIGPVVEQSRSKISIHLDAHVQETFDIYKAHQGTKMIRPKTTPIQQGNILMSADVHEMPHKNRQAFYPSTVARLQFAGRG